MLELEIMPHFSISKNIFRALQISNQGSVRKLRNAMRIGNGMSLRVTRDRELSAMVTQPSLLVRKHTKSTMYHPQFLQRYLGHYL